MKAFTVTSWKQRLLLLSLIVFALSGCKFLSSSNSKTQVPSQEDQSLPRIPSLHDAEPAPAPIVYLNGLKIFVGPERPSHQVLIVGSAGAAIGGATVHIQNTRTLAQVDITARSNGSFTTQIAAKEGDVLKMTQSMGSQTSGPIYKKVISSLPGSRQANSFRFIVKNPMDTNHWIAGSDGGLALIDPGTLNLTNSRTRVEDGLRNNEAVAITIRQNDFLIGSNHGLSRCTFTGSCQPFGNGTVLSSVSVKAMATDKRGNTYLLLTIPVDLNGGSGWVLKFRDDGRDVSIPTVPAYFPFRDLIVSPSGDVLVLGGNNGVVSGIFNLSTGTEVAQYPELANAWTFDINGNLLLAGAKEVNYVATNWFATINIITGQVISESKHIQLNNTGSMAPRAMDLVNENRQGLKVGVTFPCAEWVEGGDIISSGPTSTTGGEGGGTTFALSDWGAGSGSRYCRSYALAVYRFETGTNGSLVPRLIAFVDIGQEVTLAKLIVLPDDTFAALLGNKGIYRVDVASAEPLPMNDENLLPLQGTWNGSTSNSYVTHVVESHVLISENVTAIRREDSTGRIWVAASTDRNSYTTLDGTVAFAPLYGIQALSPDLSSLETIVDREILQSYLRQTSRATDAQLIAFADLQFELDDAGWTYLGTNEFTRASEWNKNVCIDEPNAPCPAIDQLYNYGFLWAIHHGSNGSVDIQKKSQVSRRGIYSVARQLGTENVLADMGLFWQGSWMSNVSSIYVRRHPLVFEPLGNVFYADEGYVYDPNGGEDVFEHALHYSSLLSTNPTATRVIRGQAHSMERDSSTGEIWVGTTNGVETTKGRFALEGEDVLAIHSTKFGTYVGTASGHLHLCPQPSQVQCTAVDLFGGCLPMEQMSCDTLDLPFNNVGRIQSIYNDSNSCRLFLGTSTGLYVFSNCLQSDVGVSAYTTPHEIIANILGLSGTLVIQNGGDSFTVSGNGALSMGNQFEEGARYDVQIVSQPQNQECRVTYGTGIVGKTDVRDIRIDCFDLDNLTLSVSGLVGSFIVGNNLNSEQIIITADGTYQFATPFPIDANVYIQGISFSTSQNYTVVLNPSTGPMVLRKYQYTFSSP